MLMFDECIPIAVARAFIEIGVDATHVELLGLKGTPDTQVIAYCRDHGHVLITRDVHIRRNQAELAALRAAGIGVVEIRMKNASVRELHKTITNYLAKIEATLGERPPFVHTLSRNGLDDANARRRSRP
jgi:predicted nuclease of predicted toxin-antitoxin system